MKIQLGNLAVCEFVGWAFTCHLADHLLAKLASVDDKSDYLRRRFTTEFRKAFGRAPAYFFVIELHDKDRKLVEPHVHGAIEIDELDEDDVRLAIRRACGFDLKRGQGKHNAYLGEETYGRVEKWGRYSCKTLRARAPFEWQRRHAMSNDLIGSAREFWGFIEDHTAIAMGR